MSKLWLQTRGRFELHLREQNYARNRVSLCYAQQMFHEPNSLLIANYLLFFSLQWIDAHCARCNIRSDATSHRRPRLPKMWPQGSRFLSSTNTTRRRRNETLLRVHQPELYASMDWIDVAMFGISQINRNWYNNRLAAGAFFKDKSRENIVENRRINLQWHWID